MKNKNFVIGASGRQSVDSAVISVLSHGVYVVSASSERYEINIEELQAQAQRVENLTDADGKAIGSTYLLPPTDRCVHVLANGYPINFWGFESMPEEASDMILTLLLLSAVELAMGACASSTIDHNAVNKLADK